MTCTGCWGAAGATDDDIRRAYRALARRHHPDANPEGVGAAAVAEQLPADRGRVRDPRRERDRAASTTGPRRAHRRRAVARGRARLRLARRAPPDRGGGLAWAGRFGEPGRPRALAVVREPRPAGGSRSTNGGRVGARAGSSRSPRHRAGRRDRVDGRVGERPRSGPPPPTIWCKTPDGWHDCWQATSPTAPEARQNVPIAPIGRPGLAVSPAPASG